MEEQHEKDFVRPRNKREIEKLDMRESQAKYQKQDHSMENDFWRQKYKREIEKIQALIQHFDAISKNPHESQQMRERAARFKEEKQSILDGLYEDYLDFL